MKLQTGSVPLSPAEYLDTLRRHSRSWLALDIERCTGFVWGSCFLIRYHSGRSLGRRFWPFFNKAVGWIREDNGQTKVSCFCFSGMTSPFTMLLNFLLSLFIFSYSNAPVPLLFALILTVGIALLTWACTKSSDIGRRGEEKLRELIFYTHTI